MTSRILPLIIAVGLVAVAPALAATYYYSATFSPVYDLTVDLTLDTDTSVLDLVVTGPADRWFGVGFSVDGSMANSEVLVYSNNGLEDRILDGYSAGMLNTPQTGTLVNDIVNNNVRTLAIDDWHLNFLGWNFNVHDPDTFNPYFMVWAVGSDLVYAHHVNSGTELVNFVVPEPASAALLGLAAVALLRRRRA